MATGAAGGTVLLKDLEVGKCYRLAHKFPGMDINMKALTMKHFKLLNKEYNDDFDYYSLKFKIQLPGMSTFIPTTFNSEHFPEKENTEFQEFVCESSGGKRKTLKTKSKKSKRKAKKTRKH